MKTTKSKSKSSKGSRSKAPKKSKATSNVGVQRSMIPAAYGYSVSRSGTKTCCFSNREMVETISSGAVQSTWAKWSWLVNPGRAMFPWLSAVANAFDSYRFTRLKFEYIPKCPTSLSGSVTMAFDYHCTDAPPTSEAELSRTWHCVQSACYMPMELSVDLSKFHFKSYFTCGEGLPAEETKDVGLLLFSLTNGANTNTPQGTIWVDYTIELTEPQQDESLLRMGGEFGCVRIRSMNDYAGPRSDPSAWPIDSTTNWYYALPSRDGANWKYWDSLSYVPVDPGLGTMTFPLEWQYGRIDMWVRGLVSQDLPITLATIEQFFKISFDSNSTTGNLMANCYCSMCPWYLGTTTSNYATLSYVFKRKTSTRPVVCQPLFSKAGVGDYATKFAATYLVARLTETEYDDFIQAGDMP